MSSVGLTIGLEEAEEMESERSGSGMEGEGEGEDRKVILKASECMASWSCKFSEKSDTATTVGK
jgi:hypothetical protein